MASIASSRVTLYTPSLAIDSCAAVTALTAVEKQKQKSEHPNEHFTSHIHHLGNRRQRTSETIAFLYLGNMSTTPHVQRVYQNHLRCRALVRDRRWDHTLGRDCVLQKEKSCNIIGIHYFLHGISQKKKSYQSLFLQPIHRDQKNWISRALSAMRKGKQTCRTVSGDANFQH
jgi:hypothetical protein